MIGRRGQCHNESKKQPVEFALIEKNVCSCLPDGKVGDCQFFFTRNSQFCSKTLPCFMKKLKSKEP